MQLLLQWESNNRVCVCSPRYPARNAHAPYCHLQPFRLHIIFPHYLINGAIFEKKVIEHKMCVLTFSTIFVSNIIFHSRKNWARYNQKCLLFFVQSTRYSCPILMKLKFSRQVFEKYSNIRFHKNPSSGSRVIPYGQMGRHEEAICRFSHFCERTNKMEVYKNVVAWKT